MRLLSTAGGGLLSWYGLRRGGPLGLALGAGGAGLALHGLTNLPPRRLFGYGGGRQAVEVQKSINIYAPVEDVYALWSDFTNFPRFMARVRDVRDLGSGRSHWQVAGPAGATVEWDAVVTRQEPNRLLAWKSVEGEAVQSAGIVRFDPNPDGTTRVTVRLAYNPPAGAVGHAVASLFGADPKRAMDEDLVRQTLQFLQTLYTLRPVLPPPALCLRPNLRRGRARLYFVRSAPANLCPPLLSRAPRPPG